MSEEELQRLMAVIKTLTPGQQKRISAIALAFDIPRKFSRLVDSDIVSQDVLVNFGDCLQDHHANSYQALSKDRFEYAFERALKESGISAELVKSRTNREHDITIGGIPVGLKTEAAHNIREDTIHVSKWMELGKGPWVLHALRDLFLEHMQSYSRIFTLRCLRSSPAEIRYELVEIPKALLLEAENCSLVVMEASSQNPKPGYGNPSFHYILTAGQSENFRLKGFERIYVRSTVLGHYAQRHLDKRLRASSAYSAFSSIPTHSRPSSLQTTPVVPDPKNGSSILPS